MKQSNTGNRGPKTSEPQLRAARVKLASDGTVIAVPSKTARGKLGALLARRKGLRDAYKQTVREDLERIVAQRVDSAIPFLADKFLMKNEAAAELQAEDEAAVELLAETDRALDAISRHGDRIDALLGEIKATRARMRV